MMFFENTPSNGFDSFRHDLLVNCSEESMFEEYNDNFLPENIGLPYPLHKPSTKLCPKDEVKELINQKRDYNLALESKRKKIKSGSAKLETNTIGGATYVNFPKHLLEFYITKDPDVNFDCDYNFYYTGGNLDSISLENNDYLLRPNGDNTLFLSNIAGNDVIAFDDFFTTGPIFNINHVKTSNNIAIVARQKHNVNIVTLADTERLSLNFSKKFKNSLFDAKLNNYCKPENLGLVESNLKFTLRNIETNQILFKFKNQKDTNIDHFQQFQFISANSALLCDRKEVKVLDFRAKVSNQFDAKLKECCDLCNLALFDNSLFLLSRHCVMTTDLRNFKNVHTYSHSLKSPPCYFDLKTDLDESFLVLASQENEKVLFTGSSSYSLPVGIPDLNDSLKKCFTSEPSLLLKDNLDERVNLTITGIKLLYINKDPYLYFCNSLGEIFCQKLTTKNVKGFTKKWFEWIENLKMPEPVLHLTHVEQMSRAMFALHSEPKENVKNSRTTKSKADLYLNSVQSKLKKRNLKNALARKLMDVWDESEEDEETDEDMPEVSSQAKVNTWIQSQDFISDRLKQLNE